MARLDSAVTVGRVTRVPPGNGVRGQRCSTWRRTAQTPAGGRHVRAAWNASDGGHGRSGWGGLRDPLRSSSLDHRVRCPTRRSVGEDKSAVELCCLGTRGLAAAPAGRLVPPTAESLLDPSDEASALLTAGGARGTLTPVDTSPRAPSRGSNPSYPPGRGQNPHLPTAPGQVEAIGAEGPDLPGPSRAGIAPGSSSPSHPADVG